MSIYKHVTRYFFGINPSQTFPIMNPSSVKKNYKRLSTYLHRRQKSLSASPSLLQTPIHAVRHPESCAALSLSCRQCVFIETDREGEKDGSLSFASSRVVGQVETEGDDDGGGVGEPGIVHIAKFGSAASAISIFSLKRAWAGATKAAPARSRCVVAADSLEKHPPPPQPQV